MEAKPKGTRRSVYLTAAAEVALTGLERLWDAKDINRSRGVSKLIVREAKRRKITPSVPLAGQ